MCYLYLCFIYSDISKWMKQKKRRSNAWRCDHKFVTFYRFFFLSKLKFWFYDSSFVLTLSLCRIGLRKGNKANNYVSVVDDAGRLFLLLFCFAVLAERQRSCVWNFRKFAGISHNFRSVLVIVVSERFDMNCNVCVILTPNRVDFIHKLWKNDVFFQILF